VYSTLEEAHGALTQSSYPKLLFVGDPGALISPAFAESFAKGLRNCRVVRLSSGLHYLQEDHPDVIGVTIKEWLLENGIGEHGIGETRNWEQRIGSAPKLNQ
jgi:haloalkane dehalogenase